MWEIKMFWLEQIITINMNKKNMHGGSVTFQTSL